MKADQVAWLHAVDSDGWLIHAIGVAYTMSSGHAYWFHRLLRKTIDRKALVLTWSAMLRSSTDPCWYAEVSGSIAHNRNMIYGPPRRLSDLEVLSLEAECPSSRPVGCYDWSIP